MAIGRKQRKSALYKELSGLSKLPYPLDPVNLLGRRHICNCPAVIGQVGEAATDTRAKAAAEAIRMGIDSIRVKRDRLIAEAVFGIGAYEGQSVPHRCKNLYQTQRISKAEYDKHRPYAIIGVELHLLRSAIAPPRGPSIYPNLDLPRHALLISRLAESAAQLKFDALSAIFVLNNVPEIAQLEQVVSTPETRRSMEELLHSFLAAAMRPFYFNLYCSSLSFYRMSKEAYSIPKALKWAFATDDLRGRFPIDAQRKLIGLYNDIIKSSPFTAKEISEITLTNVDRIRLDDRLTMSPGLHQLIVRWNTWYMKALDELYGSVDTQSPERRLTPLEVIVAKSGGIINILAEHGEFGWPIDGDAQLIARKNLAIWFRKDEWSPTQNGEPFGKSVDRFFENVSRRLARRATL
jgi:hypothetical protein